MKRFIAIAAAGLMAPAVVPADTVVLDDNMSTGSNWIERRTRDTGATFGYNWASDVITSQSAFTTIPASPTSTTVGLKLEVNNNSFDGDAQANQSGITIWATTEPATSNYDIEVDLFAAYAAPPIDLGGTGSTEDFGIVFQNSNDTTIAATRSTALQSARDPLNATTVVDFSSTASATGLLNDGLVFGIDPDMGNGIGTVPTNVNSNIFLYDRASAQFEAPGRTNSRGFVGFWAGAKGTTGYNVWDSPARLAGRSLTVAAQAEVNSLYQDIYDPARVAPHNTGLGYLWVKPNIQVRGNQVTLRINNFVVGTYTSTRSGKKVGISMADAFSGVSGSPSAYFISRVKITDVTILASAADWALYE